MAAVLLVLAGVGVVVGIVSGLVGIGGGVLIVPFLYFFYEQGGWGLFEVDPALHTALAHATSLFVIVPTAVQGALTYQRASLVEWRVALPLGVGALLAAGGGAWLAVALPGELLRIGFGILLLFSAVRLPGRGAIQPTHELRLSWPLMLACGLLIGLLSALLGVGGGILAIPLMIHVIGLDVRRVAATSLPVIALAASAGAIGYLIAGLGVASRPPGSLGYVHALAGAPILVGAFLSVGLGVRINQRMESRPLARMFALFFLVMGAWLVISNVVSLL